MDEFGDSGKMPKKTEVYIDGFEDSGKNMWPKAIPIFLMVITELLRDLTYYGDPGLKTLDGWTAPNQIHLPFLIGCFCFILGTIKWKPKILRLFLQIGGLVMISSCDWIYMRNTGWDPIYGFWVHIAATLALMFYCIYAFCKDSSQAKHSQP